MKLCRVLLVALFFFFTFSLLLSSSLAIKKTYIVYLGAHSHKPEESDLHQVQDSHYEFLASFLGSKEKAYESIIYSYDKHINGFAATLDEEVAAKIAENPDVVSVFLSKGLKLHTTHSWDFLNLERNGVIHPSSLWKKAKFGKDIIIANLDTGVWPESKSFGDQGYGPIPSKWKGGCQNETIVTCNRKLIGAKYFNKGYEKTMGHINASLLSARDYNGHGSHTLSTAGGNFVKGVNINGNGNWTVKGGSPRARVAAYKVCWEATPLGECADEDALQGFEAAIQDGVDVISVSLGGTPTDYIEDVQAIGAFHAVKKGIPVVCSAGNSGPDPETVTNVAPWIITVGASTIGREFISWVELDNGVRLKGLSLSKKLPGTRLYELVDGAKAKAKNASDEHAKLCIAGALDPKKIKGKILVCLRGNVSRMEKGKNAAQAGAAGMILCNANDDHVENEILADVYQLPATHINYKDGLLVYRYLNSTKKPLGYITHPAAEHTKPAPFMADFSSRGPNPVTPEILKPDITAPGVDVVAANSQAYDSPFPYFAHSGTSMSCPHVSGVVGLLKSLHPDWSPSAIKSAIMTTARTRSNTRSPMVDSYMQKTNPFSYGSGEIRPNRAMDPGLVYDLTIRDYLDFLCSLGYNETKVKMFSEEPYECPKGNSSILNLNYPSVSVPKLSGTVRIIRKLKNVGKPGVYTVRVREPVGISVVVEPKTLRFDKLGEEKSFELTVKAKRSSVSHDHLFGELLWSDGKHYVRSPIAVRVA